MMPGVVAEIQTHTKFIAFKDKLKSKNMFDLVLNGKLRLGYI
jgi:hypothetical protein